MIGDRLRVPIDEPYLHAVGLALISFARLEWDAVNCCEKLNQGYTRAVERKTAGKIAFDLVAFAKQHHDPRVVATLLPAAEEFQRLTGLRNDLVHAKPATDPGGKQRLFRSGTFWTIAMLNDLADEFTANSLELNRHFYKVL